MSNSLYWIVAVAFRRCPNLFTRLVNSVSGDHVAVELVDWRHLIIPQSALNTLNINH
jgi:hypothetical protein